MCMENTDGKVVFRDVTGDLRFGEDLMSSVKGLDGREEWFL